MISFAAFMRGKGKWISEAQEKGMKALHQHLQKAGRLTDMNSIWATFAWLIQKDHESQEYLIKLVGDHISRLEDQIKFLQEDVQFLKEGIAKAPRRRSLKEDSGSKPSDLCPARTDGPQESQTPAE